MIRKNYKNQMTLAINNHVDAIFVSPRDCKKIHGYGFYKYLEKLFNHKL